MLQTCKQGFVHQLIISFPLLNVAYLDAGLCDAALAGAGVLDDDEGVLAPSRQVLLSLPPPRLQAKLVQVHKPRGNHGCQMALARFVDRTCLPLRA